MDVWWLRSEICRWRCGRIVIWVVGFLSVDDDVENWWCGGERCFDFWFVRWCYDVCVCLVVLVKFGDDVVGLFFVEVCGWVVRVGFFVFYGIFCFCVFLLIFWIVIFGKICCCMLVILLSCFNYSVVLWLRFLLFVYGWIFGYCILCFLSWFICMDNVFG